MDKLEEEKPMRGISEERLKALYGEYQTPMESNLILMLLKGAKNSTTGSRQHEHAKRSPYFAVIRR